MIGRFCTSCQQAEPFDTGVCFLSRELGHRGCQTRPRLRDTQLNRPCKTAASHKATAMATKPVCLVEFTADSVFHMGESSKDDQKTT